ncbi:MAG: MaoC/PaaZ C-terminal domain-containing protein [Gammaproteobacteria bacterium]|nr:MaoC/PaaZ C-terminal domain-containing protein [Gammaproteobacteria bacterium]
MTDYYFEDFTPGLVVECDPFVLSEQEIIEFAEKYDAQYFHTDKQRASDHPVFQGLSAPGFQLASLAWGLAVRTGRFDACAMAGLGVDELQWPLPVRPGDELRCKFEVLEVRASESKNDRGIIIVRYEIFNQSNAKVFTMKMTQMLARRP